MRRTTSCSRASSTDPPVRPAGEAAAHRVFFPLALAAGALLVPLWVALHRTRPELAAWHAHEMLFGYAPAVLAGFLLTRLDRRVLAALVAGWLGARLAPPLGWPLIGGTASLAFMAAPGGIAAWRFLRAARKGRNRLFAVILLGMVAAEALFQAGSAGLLADGEARGVRLMLDLLTLMLLQMGGRLIPAATAGALARQGRILRDRVQPSVEAALGAAMLAIILADQVPALARAGGFAALAAAGLALLRLGRWQGWRLRGPPDLIGLHLGYGWLVLGLGLKAAASLGAAFPAVAGTHALAVGALGTLTVIVMLRTAAAREGGAALLPKPTVAIVALISAAAGARILATLAAAPAFLPVAASAWSIGLALAFQQLAWPGSHGERGVPESMQFPKSH
jgi:uncharacterized protein involved in response to NO